MELQETTQPVETPDLFWISGDSVFTSREPTRETVTGLRQNINYHLLTHDRLTLTDTSILLNEPMITLFRQEKDYLELLKEGIILPSLRTTVNNITELCKITEEKGAYTDESVVDMYRNAKLLDDINPQVCRPDFISNQELMHNIAEQYYLKKEYWIAAGLSEPISKDLISYVKDELKRNKPEYYRQTEFWDYCKELEKKKEKKSRNARIASIIRTRLTIGSLGVQAKGYNLISSFHAEYGKAVSEAYDNTFLSFEKFEDYDLANIAGDEMNHAKDRLFSYVGRLSVDDIIILRTKDPYKIFMKEFRTIDFNQDEDADVKFNTAFRKYVDEIANEANILLSNNEKEYESLKRTTRVVNYFSTALGIVAILVTKFTGIPVSSFPKNAVKYVKMASQYALGQKIKELEIDSAAKIEHSIPALKRKGAVQFELYAPTEDFPDHDEDN